MRSNISRANPRAPSDFDSPGPSTTASARSIAFSAGPTASRRQRAAGLRQADHHRLQQPHRERELEACRRADGHVAGAGAHRGQRGHRRGAGQPARAAEDEHVARGELRRVGAAPRHLAQHAAVEQPDLGLRRAAARDPDVDHVDGPGVLLAGRDPESRAWRGGTSPSPIAATASPSTCAGRGVDAARDVRGDHARLGGVDRGDHLVGRLARRTLEARAEQRVDDHVGALERVLLERLRRGPGEPLEHLLRVALQPLARPHEPDVDLAAGLAQQPRGDEPVAAVVALAADDHDAAGGRVPRDRVGEPLPRALHQLQRRDRLRLDRPLVGRAHLLGVEQRVQPAREAHRATRGRIALTIRAGQYRGSDSPVL